MNIAKVDTVIIGQGLAGTALAWALIDRGERILVIDKNDDHSASNVAAGLVTPIAGKRFAVAEHYAELFKYAQHFYADIEKRLQVSFFHRRAAIRLCYTDEEVELFSKRKTTLISAGYATDDVALPSGIFKKSRLQFSMPGAARLNTSTYLAHSRRFFLSSGQLVNQTHNHQDLKVNEHSVELNAGKLRAKRVVFCRGAADQQNPWLPKDVFNCAKGEILTVRIDGLNECRTVHANKSWLCAGAPGLFEFGATYEHDGYIEKTTQLARNELTGRLAKLLRVPFVVEGQHFGVRPIGMQRKPIVGKHATHGHVAWLNGLGSKGALHAPYLAACLADGLRSGRPIDVSLLDAHTDA